jgi:hypothetical protein
MNWDRKITEKSLLFCSDEMVDIFNVGESSITVPDYMKVHHVEVTVWTNHSSVSSVIIKIKSPQKTDVNLAIPHPDTYSRWDGWRFLSRLHWGEEINGDWTLIVSGFGRLERWCLNLHGDDSTYIPPEIVPEPEIIPIPQIEPVPTSEIAPEPEITPIPQIEPVPTSEIVPAPQSEQIPSPLPSENMPQPEITPIPQIEPVPTSEIVPEPQIPQSEEIPLPEIPQSETIPSPESESLPPKIEPTSENIQPELEPEPLQSEPTPQTELVPEPLQSEPTPDQLPTIITPIFENSSLEISEENRIENSNEPHLAVIISVPLAATTIIAISIIIWKRYHILDEEKEIQIL